MTMSSICLAFHSMRSTFRQAESLNPYNLPVQGGYITSQYSRHDLPHFIDEETAALRDLPKPVWQGPDSNLRTAASKVSALSTDPAATLKVVALDRNTERQLLFTMRPLPCSVEQVT